MKHILLLFIIFLVSSAAFAETNTPSPTDMRDLRAATPSDMLDRADRLYESGKYEQAMDIYRKAARRGTTQIAEAAEYKTGLCLREMCRHKDAVRQWRKMLTRYPAGAFRENASLETARTLVLKLNDMDAAAKTYQEFLSKYPDSYLVPGAFYETGCVLYQLGRYQEAMEKFQSAVETLSDGNRKNSSVYYMKECAQILQQTEQPDAGPVFTKSVSADEMEKRLQPLELSSLKSGNTGDELEQADILFEQCRYEEAVRAYRLFSKNNTFRKGHDKALFMLGRCYSELGDDRKAFAAWEELLRIPDWKMKNACKDLALLAMADAYFDFLDESGKAMSLYQEILKKYPESEVRAEAERQIALIHFYEGRFSRALVIFEKELATMSVDPQNPPLELLAMIDACRQKQTARSKPLVHINRAERLVRQGDVYRLAGEYDKAREVYERAEREASGTETGAYALFSAGRCFNQLGKYRKALRCYDSFSRKYKDSKHAAPAILRAGVIYVGPLNDPESGIKMYKKIMELYPGSEAAPNALYNMATLALWRGKLKESFRLHTELIKKHPGNNYAQYAAQRRLPEIRSAANEKGGK